MKKLKKQIPADALNSNKMKHMEAIVLSMTPKERERPEIIKGTRRKRIAKGSGTSVLEVNRLLKQFGEMRKMMRSKGKMKQMMQQMGGMEGMGDMLGGGKGGELNMDDLDMSKLGDMSKKFGGKGGGLPF